MSERITLTLRILAERQGGIKAIVEAVDGQTIAQASSATGSLTVAFSHLSARLAAHPELKRQVAALGAAAELLVDGSRMEILDDARLLVAPVLPRGAGIAGQLASATVEWDKIEGRARFGFDPKREVTRDGHPWLMIWGDAAEGGRPSATGDSVEECLAELWKPQLAMHPEKWDGIARTIGALVRACIPACREEGDAQPLGYAESAEIARRQGIADAKEQRGGEGVTP